MCTLCTNSRNARWKLDLQSALGSWKVSSALGRPWQGDEKYTSCSMICEKVILKTPIFGLSTHRLSVFCPLSMTSKQPHPFSCVKRGKFLVSSRAVLGQKLLVQILGIAIVMYETFPQNWAAFRLCGAFPRISIWLPFHKECALYVRTLEMQDESLTCKVHL